MIGLKRLIENGFYSGKHLSEIAKNLFDLDDEFFVILGIIAEYGPINEYKIKDIACKKYSHTFSREIIHPRLRQGCDKELLIRKKQLIKQDGEKQIDFYHLTLKGFIASLCITSFEENYLVKNFKTFLEKKINICNIPEIAIYAIKYNLASFMISNILTNSKLTNSDSLAFSIFQNNNSPAIRAISPRIRNNKKIIQIEYEIIVKSYTVQKILNQAFWSAESMLKNKKIADKNFPNEGYEKILFRLEEISDFVKYWYDFIEEPEMIRRHTFTMTELGNIEKESGQISFKTINFEANQILTKLGMKSKIEDMFDEELFFEKFQRNKYSRSH